MRTRSWIGKPLKSVWKIGRSYDHVSNRVFMNSGFVIHKIKHFQVRTCGHNSSWILILVKEIAFLQISYTNSATLDTIENIFKQYHTPATWKRQKLNSSKNLQTYLYNRDFQTPSVIPDVVLKVKCGLFGAFFSLFFGILGIWRTLTAYKNKACVVSPV